MRNKCAVFIGRFQPFHIAHLEIVRCAYNIASKIIVIVGSKTSPFSLKNPFSFNERKSFISDTLTEIGIHNFQIKGVDDYECDDQWVKEVVNLIPDSNSITLIGHNKDSSSYYLNLFPQYEYLEVEQQINVSGTMIRESLYRDEMNLIKDVVPQPVYNFLTKFRNTKRYGKIIDSINK